MVEGFNMQINAAWAGKDSHLSSSGGLLTDWTRTMVWAVDLDDGKSIGDLDRPKAKTRDPKIFDPTIVHSDLGSDYLHEQS